jgi:hypothetical protein
MISLTDHVSGAERLRNLVVDTTLDEATELLGGCRLHDKRLLVLHVTKNAFGVLLWCFLHFVPF